MMASRFTPTDLAAFGGEGERAEVYFVAMEVERFGNLRRSVGYAIANELMSRIAARIVEAMPGSEVGRAGRTSLEFAFTARSDAQAQARLMPLNTTVSRRLVADGFEFDLDLTMGVAKAPDGVVTEAVIDLAEAALADARARHRRLLFATGEEVNAVSDRLLLMRDLRGAIANDELELHYQPKLRARTGVVDAAEALLRWRHPERGAIPPDIFIRLAEETGNIRALTDWVIERGLRDHQRLRAQGRACKLDVNISGALLADPDFAAWVLARLGPTPDAIGFEITETAMIVDPEGALSNLNTFAELGIRLAIDDYGSGFSSLTYLRQLPVHELKLDRSFISSIAATSRDPLLVRSTIDLAHALGMEVTAEGIDTPEALALLRVMGCDLLQGFLIARPLPFDDFCAFLAKEVRLDSLLPAPGFGLSRRPAPVARTG